MTEVYINGQSIKVGSTGGASYTAGDGITIEGDTISIDNPMHGIISQEEFDALTEEQQNKGTYIISGLNNGGGDGGSGGSAQEIYSTEETRIGTWIDGKPLYRKVYTGTTPSANGNDIRFGTLPSGIDTIIDIRGMINDPLNRYPIQWAAPNQTGTIGVCVWNTGLYWEINLNSGGSILFEKPFCCIVEYTKTTDAAIQSISTISDHMEAVTAGTYGTEVTG